MMRNLAIVIHTPSWPVCSGVDDRSNEIVSYTESTGAATRKISSIEVDPRQTLSAPAI